MLAMPTARSTSSMARSCVMRRRVRRRRLRRRGSRGCEADDVVSSGIGDKMSGIWQDIRYAMRGFARARGVTLVSVLTIGLGIGATAVIFSLVDALLLRPLPVEEMDRKSTRLNSSHVAISYA